MDKLRVGIVINPDNIPSNGGSFSYYQTLLNGINEFKFNDDIEIVNIVFYHSIKPEITLNKQKLFIKTSIRAQVKKMAGTYTKGTLIADLLKQNPTYRYLYSILKERRNKKVESILISNNIHLLYYLMPQHNILNYPFIVSHWDIGHRSMYPFPEVAQNGNYESREAYYNYTLNKAMLILCESQAGVNELKQYFPYYQPKIWVTPIFASDIINLSVDAFRQQQILQAYKMKRNEFFIYPAQFWALKNHYNLILAFKQLIKQEPNKHVKLVLCGSDKGNLVYIKELIASLELSENVIITGFVTDEELVAFYKNAIALVMPTFLGPTNMPLIEAAHLGCPVICSDLQGQREIMDDHALYFNPANANEIEAAMAQIKAIPNREEWMKNAHEHINHSPFNLSNSLEVLNNALLDIIPIRKTWSVDSRMY